MTIRHLKIFVAVCECGGVTKAAERLYIAQPTISHAIAELEKYYNVRLFERINQRLVLNDVGKELLVKAKEILSGFEDFEHLAAQSNQSSRVKIGASLTLGQTVIPKFTKLLDSEYPNIQSRIIIRSSAEIEREIENGNIDFAIVEGEVSSPYLSAKPFNEDRLVTVSSVDFDVPDTLTVEQLAEYPLLLREHESIARERFERAVSHSGFHVEPKIDSINNQALVAAVFASLGIALLPESFVHGHIERGKLKEIKIEGLNDNRTNYIVMHKNKKLNSMQRQAYELLKTFDRN